MSFKDKLKEKRLEANLTQVQLAEKVSVTARTIQNYELGTRKPTKLEIVEKLAKALNTTPEYLLGQNGLLVVAAHEQGGAKAARDIDQILYKCRAASKKVGGGGIRYTVMIRGRESYLFQEGTKWFVEAKEGAR